MSSTIESLTPLDLFFAQYGMLLLSAILVIYALTAIILLSLINRRDKKFATVNMDEDAFVQKCNSLLDEIVKLRSSYKGVEIIKEKDIDEQLRTLEKIIINGKLNTK